MPKSEQIWHNGKLIPWDDAKIHVLSHVVNYGPSPLEGIRCCAPPQELERRAFECRSNLICLRTTVACCGAVKMADGTPLRRK